MNKLETLEEQYKIGKPILLELFKLNKDELREKLKDICGDKVDKDVIEEGGIKKTIEDDEPTKIEVCFYGSIISITSFGINFKPEHGVYKNVIEFNKYFQLGTVKTENDIDWNNIFEDFYAQFDKEIRSGEFERNILIKFKAWVKEKYHAPKNK